MSNDQHPSPPAANDEHSDLATLKALLIGREQAALRELQAELDDREAQTHRIANSLPGALHSACREAPRELTLALEQPVTATIEDSVRRNPGLFAEALYPVMGPAIRRSISQAMKALVQQINQTLEHSLTVKGLRWRLEALRTGIPFAEIVLRHTLRFRVEEVFLIQTGSGLLIQHLRGDAARATDPDAVSAMLTAIRDFAHDTLDREDAETRLDTVDVGEHTLWLIHGPEAYLACAIRGVPPVELRDDLSSVLEEIHSRHLRLLAEFDGDAAQAATIAPLLEPCLQSESTERPGHGLRLPLLLILLALTGLLIWWGYDRWQAHIQSGTRDARQQAAVTRLAATPGIVLTDWRMRDGRLHLEGLHDPLAEAPQRVLAAAGLAPGEYRLDFGRHQSSDPGPALARARQRLAPPDTVTLALADDGTLVATGHAPTRWIERAALLATTVPGVEAYDDQALTSADLHLREALLERLQPPRGVTLEVTNGVAELAGLAPLAWIATLPESLPDLPGLAAIRHAGLEPLEAERFEQLVQVIDDTVIRFEEGSALGEAAGAQIAALGALLAQAHSHARSLDRAVELRIIGRTDAIGSPQQNHALAWRRAEAVAQALAATGRELPHSQLRAVIQPASHALPEPALRRVEFRLLSVGRPRGGQDTAP